MWKKNFGAAFQINDEQVFFIFIMSSYAFTFSESNVLLCDDDAPHESYLKEAYIYNNNNWELAL